MRKMLRNKKNVIRGVMAAALLYAAPVTAQAAVQELPLQPSVCIGYDTYIDLVNPETMEVLDKFTLVYETRYTTTRLNIRTYPNLDSTTVYEVAEPGHELILVARNDDGWALVSYKDKWLFCAEEYLSTDKPAINTKKSSESLITNSNNYLGTFRLTGYCSCSRCCGSWSGGPTASGAYPVAGRTVAMGGVPFGTKLLINGQVYTVEDRGTPYGHVDIYFGSHGEALNFGTQYTEVYRVE